MAVTTEQSAPADTTNAAPVVSSRRPLWIVVCALLVSSLALWGSGKLPWSAEIRDAGVRGMVVVTRSGAEHNSVIIPFALLTLTAIAGFIAAGSVLRRVIGGLLIAVGVITVWQLLRDIPVNELINSPQDYPTGKIVLGRFCALIGGILLSITGFFIIIRAKTFPRLGKRYSSPASGRAQRDSGTEMWEALSHGEDPTAQR